MKELGVKEALVFFLFVFFSFGLGFAADSQYSSQVDWIVSSSLSMEDTLFPPLPINFAYSENGIEIEAIREIPGAILYYRQYHELSDSRAFGNIGLNKSIYCPYDSTVCMWLEYADGIKSRAQLFYIKRPSSDLMTNSALMQVFSPEPGIWKKAPILHVSYPAGTTVYYSLDGSDPQTFGQIYDKPFVIERYGLVNLRLKAVSENGFVEEKNISYSVHASGQERNSYLYFLTELPAIETSTELLSLVDTSPQSTKPYQVLGWNYLEFLLQTPISYEVSTMPTAPVSFPKIAKTYSGPIFLDRSQDLYVFWSSDTISDGRVQTIFLPAKPKLIVKERAIGASQPVHIELSDKRYTYTFTVADKFTAPEPTLYSHSFDSNQIDFDIPDGQQFHYNVRIKAFYGGISHGEYFVDFNINKKKPPTLIPEFSTELASTNELVYMRLPKLPADSPYYSVVRITPQAQRVDENTYLLDGIGDENRIYRIIAYYEDADGNRGEVFTREIEVSPFAIYVDSNALSSGNGTKDAPFTKLERAFSFIKDSTQRVGVKKKWNLFIRGNFTISDSQVLSDNIRIVGSDAKILLENNVGFIIENADVAFSGLTFIRTEQELDSKLVPVLYASNSTLNLSDIQFNTRYDGTAVSMYFSIGVFKRVQYTSIQKKYTECFVFSKSELMCEDFDFSLNCDSAIGFRIDSSFVALKDCAFSIECETVCRLLNIQKSQVDLNNFIGIRKPERYNTDTAVLFDPETTLKKTGTFTIEGFKYELRN